MSSRYPKSLLSGFILILLAQYPVACSAEAIHPTAEEKAQVEFERKPNSYFEERLKEPPVQVDGQQLHPKYQYYLEERASRGGDLSPEEKRRQQAERLKDPEIAARMRASVDRSWTFRTKETADMASVEDRQIPGPAGPVDVRIYKPHTDQKSPLPVLVYYHGGGWLFGSVEAVDRAVRLIANEADVIVVSVDYRMAPAHKFPAAHEDAFAVFDWVSENAETLGGDPSRIGVGGGLEDRARFGEARRAGGGAEIGEVLGFERLRLGGLGEAGSRGQEPGTAGGGQYPAVPVASAARAHGELLHSGLRRNTVDENDQGGCHHWR